MPAVITRGELERMRKSTQPVLVTDAEARRRHLKMLSDEKVKSWPNTLQAMRKKKENWKKERLEAEEEARKKIDREEAELQRERRAAAIDRARKIMYEQTDKMKNLRSQQLYSEVVGDRAEQVRERQVMRDWERDKEAAYHEEIMRQVQEGDRREEAEAAARTYKAKAIAASQYEQLNEFRGNYLERLRAEKQEGELIQRKAAQDLDEEARIAEERTIKARMQMKEMQLANAHLKKLKLQDALKEEEATRKRQAEKDRNEHLAAERKRLEQARFASRQATKQRLIDAASAELATRISNEATLLESQVAALRKKEDDLEALKLANIEKQKKAIDLSRTQQLEQRDLERQRDQQAIDDMVAAWKIKNAEIDDEEANEQARLKAKNAEIRDSLLAQIDKNAKLRAKAIAETLAFDRMTRAAIEADEAKFRATATEVLEKARAEAKPTYMLEKARAAKDITIMGAMGSRI